MQDTCPNTQRLVRLHFGPSADHSMARLLYFAIGDEVCLDMYAIFAHESEHDSGDKLDSSLPLF